ncbi:MAG: isoprenoid biosynthesis glyoxalase ElbB [Bdellovibrionales bacterium]|nr:isoprenoid biosynthesis glyoxalase ElbB [Bdellovibrionales bacterium]
MKKIAVVLSGCGNKDGSEITEAVSALITLSELGVQYSFFAPDIQRESINFLTNQEAEKRNVLQESARIARGKIHDVVQLKSSDFDGLLFPGGYGVAKNLCDFASKGAQGSVLPSIEKIVLEFYQQKKPMAAICIAPALLALVLGQNKITVTIGKDAGVAEEIRKTGAFHENCSVKDYVSDREHKIITTPAYMYDHASPFEVYTGIRGAVKEFVEMA